jgi:hypothetical protein
LGGKIDNTTNITEEKMTKKSIAIFMLITACALAAGAQDKAELERQENLRLYQLLLKSGRELTAGDYTIRALDKQAVITKYHGSDIHIDIPKTLGGCTVFGIGERAFDTSFVFYSGSEAMYRTFRVKILSVVIPKSVRVIAHSALSFWDGGKEGGPMNLSGSIVCVTIGGNVELQPYSRTNYRNKDFALTYEYHERAAGTYVFSNELGDWHANGWIKTTPQRGEAVILAAQAEERAEQDYARYEDILKNGKEIVSGDYTIRVLDKEAVITDGKWVYDFSKEEDNVDPRQEGKIRIHAKIAGYTVFGIKAAFNVFSSMGPMWSLTSVDIPEGVKVIGQGAFWGNSLERIAIPKSVTKIAKRAFSGGEITTVTIGSFVQIEQDTDSWREYHSFTDTFRTAYRDHDYAAGTYVYVEAEKKWVKRR